MDATEFLAIQTQWLSESEQEFRDMEAVNAIIRRTMTELHSLGYSKERAKMLFMMGGFPEWQVNNMAIRVIELRNSVKQLESLATIETHGNMTVNPITPPPVSCTMFVVVDTAGCGKDAINYIYPDRKSAEDCIRLFADAGNDVNSWMIAEYPLDTPVTKP